MPYSLGSNTYTGSTDVAPWQAAASGSWSCRRRSFRNHTRAGLRPPGMPGGLVPQPPMRLGSCRSARGGRVYACELVEVVTENAGARQDMVRAYTGRQGEVCVCDGTAAWWYVPGWEAGPWRLPGHGRGAAGSVQLGPAPAARRTAATRDDGSAGSSGRPSAWPSPTTYTTHGDTPGLLRGWHGTQQRQLPVAVSRPGGVFRAAAPVGVAAAAAAAGPAAVHCCCCSLPQTGAKRTPQLHGVVHW